MTYNKKFSLSGGTRLAATRFALYAMMALSSLSLLPKASHAADASWMKDLKYGINIHSQYRTFVAHIGGSATSAGWNQIVDNYNVEKFADQLKAIGAGWVWFHVMDGNSGYFAAPNAIYDQYTGYAAGERCSNRDLVMDIANALQARGIKLFLYVVGRAPQGDLKACVALGDNCSHIIEMPYNFEVKWEDVLREWSLRYGTKVSGWWVDGMYAVSCLKDYTKPHNWHTFAGALRAGNPNAVLSFNCGYYNCQVDTMCGEMDYSSGEGQKGYNLIVNSQNYPRLRPTAAGRQWQFVFPLSGEWGGCGQSLYSAKNLITYIDTLYNQKGCCTIDLGFNADGSFCQAGIDTMTIVRNAIWGKAPTAVMSPAGPAGAHGNSVRGIYCSLAQNASWARRLSGASGVFDVRGRSLSREAFTKAKGIFYVIDDLGSPRY
ncbi:MAG: hypothetical protein PHC61_01555 [Chitinivibrionales bacterium]|nr:hypothetical protein [Chitinivibrionales bacterium]